MDKFNLKQFRGRKTITLKHSSHQGVRRVFDWCPKKERYIKRASGKKYCALFKKEGKQKECWFETFEEAVSWRKNGGEVYKNSNDLRFSEVVEKFFESKKGKVEPSTLDTYRTYTNHFEFFHPYRVSEITPSVIDQWLRIVKEPAYLKQMNSSRMSFKKEIKLLGQIFNYVFEYDLLVNFTSPIRKRHREDAIICKARYREKQLRDEQKFLSGDEINHFLDELLRWVNEKPLERIYFYGVGILQLRSGLRVGEATALNFEDFQKAEFEGYKVNVSKTVVNKRSKAGQMYIKRGTKTGRSRQVYVSSDVYEAVQFISSLSGRYEGLVFTKNGITPIKYRAVQYVYDKILKRINSPFTGSHLMRHTFSTSFFHNTGDQGALQKILGHTTGRQTELYAKRTDEMAVRGYQQYSEKLEQVGSNVVKLDQWIGKAGKVVSKNI